MEPIFAFVLMFVFLVVVMVFVIKKQMEDKRKREEAYAQIATERSGHIEPGGWFSVSKLHFAVNDHRAHVEHYSTGGKHPTYYTRMYISIDPLPVKSLQIYTEGAFAKLSKVFNAQDIQIGIPAFDEAFMIKGEDELFVREVLTEEARAAFLAMRAYAQSEYVGVGIEDSEMLVQVMGWRNELDELKTFIDDAETVFFAYCYAAERYS